MRPIIRRPESPALFPFQALQATGEIRDRLEALTKKAVDAPLLSTGVHEFESSRDPSKVYRVTFDGAGHLECIARVSVGAATVKMFGRLEKVYKSTKAVARPVRYNT